MILQIACYIVLTGGVAVHIAALQEAEMSVLLKIALKKWAVFLAIGAFVLLWLSLAQSPEILP